MHSDHTVVPCDVDCEGCSAILSEIPNHRERTCSVQRVLPAMQGTTEQPNFTSPEADKQDYPSVIAPSCGGLTQTMEPPKEFICVCKYSRCKLTSLTLLLKCNF